MVKVTQVSIPPEFRESFKEAFRDYDSRSIPIFSAKWFQDTRLGILRRRAQSLFDKVSVDWKALDDETRQTWKNAAFKAYGYYRGFRLFTSDWIYRYEQKLSVPGSPNIYHQLFGLRAYCPGEYQLSYFNVHLKDLIGPLTVKFDYKKNILPGGGTPAFMLSPNAYYFAAGRSANDHEYWNSPAGSQPWSHVEHTWAISDRHYFHVVLNFNVGWGELEVFFDNLVVEDKNGEVSRENFNVKRYKPAALEPLYRKEGWEFNPAYAEPYFKHLYLT